MIFLMALLTLTISQEGGEEALRAVSALTTADRTAAHQVMAAGVERLTQAHVMGLPSTKGSAAKLGASASGFYKKAAGSVQGKGDGTGVMLSMQRAGLSRAFRPYDLVPKAGQLLTIPVAAEAYGRRAGEFGDGKWRRFSDEDVAAGLSDKAGLVFGRPAPEPGGLFHALFIGVKKVHQDQDRTLLPSDQVWLEEMAEGALSLLD
jgi:hypothetical protein